MAWKGNDEVLTYMIEPTFFCQVAEQGCEMKANQVELIGKPFIYDAQIVAITTCFVIAEEARSLWAT